MPRYLSWLCAGEIYQSKHTLWRCERNALLGLRNNAGDELVLCRAGQCLFSATSSAACGIQGIQPQTRRASSQMLVCSLIPVLET